MLKNGLVAVFVVIVDSQNYIYNNRYMNIYTATVIKTGNSVALRVPKQYADAAKLTPGDKVSLSLPVKQKEQDHAKIKRLIAKLQTLNAYDTIANPVSWQKDIRQDRSLPGRP